MIRSARMTSESDGGVLGMYAWGESHQPEDAMGAAAAIILRRERDIVNAYRGAGATNPERAVQPEDIGVDRRLVFDRLVRRAVLREAGDGRYYLDEPSWEAIAYVRRRLAIVIIMIVVAVLITLVMSGAVNFGTARAS
jgi:hypothetical protein